MGMLQGAVLVLGVLLQLCDGEVCVQSSTTGGQTTKTYTDCAELCCGDVNKQYCCESNNSALVIAVVATSVVFIILIIGIAICCMKNHTRHKTRVAVLHITETQNAAARRDERRERRQREAAAAMGAYPQYMPGYPGVPPPSYNSMYGENLPPGAYAESSYPPPQPNMPSTSYDGAGAMGGMDHYPTKH